MTGQTQTSTRRRSWFIAVVVLAALVFSTTSAHHGAGKARPPRAAVATKTRPNVLVIVADDQTGSTFNRRIMPNTYAQLVDQGVYFDRAYINTSLCCPSRSQIFTGLYATDTNVTGNHDLLERPTVLQAFKDAGYRTVMAGKYLNTHPCDVWPVEYDEWYCYVGTHSSEKNPTVDVNGVAEKFIGYSADILAGYLKRFIATTPPDQPFIAYYTPKVPHVPANDDRFNSMKVPLYRPPNYDENTNIDGKPAYTHRGPLTPAEIANTDAVYAAMYRSAHGLDLGVATVLGALGSRAANTIVIYISDNGFMYGEHRWDLGKTVPYEESVRMPMIVRYPALHSVTDPVVSHALVQNVDIAPTIADAAGIAWHADGTSLLPLIDGTRTSVRDAALIEFCMPNVGRACWNVSHRVHVPPYLGVVTSRYKYVEYYTKEKELYDLTADRYELVNHANDPNWAGIQATLAAKLAQFRVEPVPDTTIVAGPAAIVAPGPQTFTYFTQGFASKYQCRLSSAGNPGTWAPCGWQTTTVGPLGSGTYTFSVAGVANGVVDATPAARAFTVDDSLPVASVADATMTDDDQVPFVISLDRAPTTAVSVTYDTTDVTAESGDDYSATWGVATFAVGQTQARVNVPVNDDHAGKGPMTFRLHIMNPVGATLGRTFATGTINGDGESPPAQSSANKL